jgi:hypothetical protein
MSCKAIRQNDEMFCHACGFRWDVDDMFPPSCRPARPRTTVLGLSGAAGSGKSSVAEYLEQRHGYRRLRFAQPLKDALRRMLQSAMLDDHSIERMVEGDLKELPTPILMGKTPRHAMQTLGTEWGRNCIDGNFWVNVMRHTIRALPPATRVVIEDVRFENEASMVRDFGGKVIRLTGRGGLTDKSHPSENGVTPDVTFDNSWSMSDLRAWVDQYVTSQ